jgi:hypothetical protein
MAHPLWLYPTPAQDTDFLQLHYLNSYGYPDGATSGIYLHPWNGGDFYGMAAEVEIFRDTEDGFRVRLIRYTWNPTEAGASLTSFERYNGCDVAVWDTHETFGRFCDAEAFAQFAWGRWRDGGSGGCAGMELRDDLDRMLNPIPQHPAQV